MSATVFLKILALMITSIQVEHSSIVQLDYFFKIILSLESSSGATKFSCCHCILFICYFTYLFIYLFIYVFIYLFINLFFLDCLSFYCLPLFTNCK